MKFKIAFGFVLIAGGLFGGATTNLNSSDAFTAAWVFVVGVGLGLALPASMDAAIGELSPERSGIGSAQIQAVRQVGATFGVAVLGSVINSAYRNHLILTGLPAQASAAVKDSVSAGVAVAHQFGSPQLLDSVRRAFVHGMDVMLVVCGGIAVVSVILTLAFLPRRRSPVPAVATPVTTGGGAGKV
jgi:hypothetical protein